MLNTRDDGYSILLVMMQNYKGFECLTFRARDKLSNHSATGMFIDWSKSRAVLTTCVDARSTMSKMSKMSKMVANLLLMILTDTFFS